LQANAQQKQQIESIPALKKEIEDLEALCRLYMESNPNYDKKTPTITPKDVQNAVAESLALVGQVASLSALIAEDASFIECNDAERAALEGVHTAFNKMHQGASEGSKTFAKGNATKAFVDTFGKLANGSSDSVTEGGVSFENLKQFVNKCFSDNAQIVQRIADKELSVKRQQQQAAEEAARQAAEEKKAAAKAREAERAAAAAAAAAEKAAAEEKSAAAKNTKEDSTAKEESKDTSAVEATGTGEDEGNGQAEEGGAQDTRGGRGGRGGRRGDGERRGRGGRGGRGGDRGNNRGRGGYRGPREDEDGFVVETGEKPKPRRGNFRGQRGDRGDFRGGRGGRNSAGDWERRGRGGRPETAGGDNNGAPYEQQPAAQTATAQAAAAQSEV